MNPARHIRALKYQLACRDEECRRLRVIIAVQGMLLGAVILMWLVSKLAQ